jgi:protocatechuate 3,4-dioxygenase beta subunit
MQRRTLLKLTTTFVVGASLSAPQMLFSTVAAQQPANTARLWRDGDSGERLNLRGRVTDPSGRPVAGAVVNTRQADGDAVYTPQYAATLVSGKDGSYRIATVLPGQYAGDKHIHVTVEHPDYLPFFQTIVFKGDNNDPNGVVLEESRIKRVLVWQGRYDIKLQKP